MKVSVLGSFFPNVKPKTSWQQLKPLISSPTQKLLWKKSSFFFFFFKSTFYMLRAHFGFSELNATSRMDYQMFLFLLKTKSFLLSENRASFTLHETSQTMKTAGLMLLCLFLLLLLGELRARKGQERTD